MQAAIPFPDIAPEIFSIGIGNFTFALRWYALAYLAGILIGWRMVIALVARPGLWGGTAPMTRPQVDDFLTAAILGVILGGRLGYVFFYKPEIYLSDPGAILRVWEGGMAFHGGVLGVVAAGFWFAGKHDIPRRALADAVAVAVPAGLFLGRIANFINAELWGHPTERPWGVIFPGVEAQACGQPPTELCARHPSQLYEAGLEGLLLGLILWALVLRGGLRRPGLVAGVFLVGYSLARAFAELFRQADAQFIALDNTLGHVLRLSESFGLSMGQALSIPMLAIGLWLIVTARRA